LRLTVIGLVLAMAAVASPPAFAEPPAQAPAQAQAQGPSPIFRPIDVFGLRWASDPQIRPDGGVVAFVREANSIMSDRAEPSIRLVDTATGALSPLGAGGPARSPRWSPDGKRLAYVAGAEGATPQLYVRWMATGAVAKVADLPQAPSHIAWSPDGTRIAFAMFTPDTGATLGAPMVKPEGAKWAEPLKVIDQVSFRFDGAGYLKPGYRHIFVVSADGGSPRQLTFGAVDDGGALSWSADGRSILFSADRAPGWQRRAEHADIWRVGVDDGALTELLHTDGPSSDPALSPDGSKIAYVGFTDTHKPYQDAKLYVADADGSHRRSLTDSLNRGVSQPRWAADGRSLFVQFADHGVTKVARVSLAGGQPVTVASGLVGAELDRPYAGGEYSVARSGAVAFTQGNWDQPPDIAVASGSATRRLTRLNDDLFHGKTLSRVTPFAVVSAFDKQPIDAWMVTPPTFDPASKYPMILEIHGGPYAAYGPAWSSEDQLYAAAGYVVVYANPRGSTSYGQTFADGIEANYPGHDYDDLMSVVDTAIAKGSVDPNNLFVTGGSGGGLLTAWIVGKTDRFRAAASQKPVINWTSWGLTTDMYLIGTGYWFSKPPWENQAAYWSHSPLSLIGAVKTPTLVMVGEEDHRTPPSEAEQFYQALQVAKVPTTLIRVPGASHGGLAERPSQLAAENAAILAWFGRYRTAD
jgi:dipeptidyl aminopeptidase/acylaminoacyl peptidase